MSISNRFESYVPERRSIEAKWERYRGMFIQLLENPLTAIGMVIIAAFIVTALLTPFLMPGQGQDPYQMPRDWGAAESPPGTPGHPLGTNGNGGDILYGILWGSRLSIAISLGVVVTTTVIGVIFGGIAGYLGGKIDELIMRIVDAMISIPGLVWAIAVVTALGPSYFNIAIALMTMYWGTYARIIRGEVIHVKNEEYVDAARVEGVSELSIFFKEVLPNSMPPIFVQSSLYFGRIVLTAASVAFIGLAEPGLAEWGRIIAMGQNGLMAGRWWTSVIPGFAIFFWAFGWNMIGDGLRDVIDPRTESH